MNFIKNQIVQIANLAIIAGIGLTAVGLWTMFEERNVSSEPKIMDLASLESQGDDMVYATVNGGTPDMTQVFEYSVKTRKQKTTLLTKYFVPVIDTTDNSVAYILETATNPASLEISSAGFTGLLQNSSALPDDIAQAYNQAYQGKSYPYLDESFEPKSITDGLLKVALFLGIAIAGFVIRQLLVRKRDSGRVNTQARANHQADPRRANFREADSRRADSRRADYREVDPRRQSSNRA